MVPIVGWIMASHGGMPINRGHRDAAVQVWREKNDAFSSVTRVAQSRGGGSRGI